MPKLGTVIRTILLTSLATMLVLQPNALIAAKTNAKSVDILEKSQRFREEMGLDGDSKTLQSLLNEERKLSKYGVLLTENEEKELDARFKKQKDRIPKIREYINKNLKNEFAGLYIDQSQGGVVKVGFKKSEKEKVEKLVDELKELYDEDIIEVYYAEHTNEELNDLADKISEDRITLKKEGIELSSVSVNLPNQQIDIGVTKLNSKVTKKLEDKYGKNILHIFEEEIHKAEADPDDYYRPIEAGLEIEGNIRACTAAFSAQSESDPDDFYVITAGHCIDNIGEDWEQGNSKFGDVTDYQFGGSIDVGLIELDEGSDDATYYLFGNGKHKLESIDDIQSFSEEEVGDPVCISGAATGSVTCGTIKSTNWKGYIRHPDGSTEYFTNMRQASYSSRSGDSGAPVFIGGTAVGVHSASGGIYTHIRYIINEFDVDLLLGN
jgi:thioredoxin-related protein